jgi:hypothetical protein
MNSAKNLTLFSWHSLETIMMGYKLLLTLT